MPQSSVAPKVGAAKPGHVAKAAPKAPAVNTETKTETSVAAQPPASKVPGTGTKSPIATPPPRVQPVSKYSLPDLSPSLVVKLFENIPEYRQHKIVDLDALIKGMLYLAVQPVNGIGPGGLPVEATPLNNFLAQLVMLAVEKGSKGVERNS